MKTPISSIFMLCSTVLMQKQDLTSISTSRIERKTSSLVATRSCLAINIISGFCIKGYESVQLNLEDVNDESPVFDSPSYQILLQEVSIIKIGIIFSLEEKLGDGM